MIPERRLLSLPSLYSNKNNKNVILFYYTSCRDVVLRHHHYRRYNCYGSSSVSSLLSSTTTTTTTTTPMLLTNATIRAVKLPVIRQQHHQQQQQEWRRFFQTTTTDTTRAFGSLLSSSFRRNGNDDSVSVVAMATLLSTIGGGIILLLSAATTQQQQQQLVEAKPDDAVCKKYEQKHSYSTTPTTTTTTTSSSSTIITNFPFVLPKFLLLLLFVRPTSTTLCDSGPVQSNNTINPNPQGEEVKKTNDTSSTTTSIDNNDNSNNNNEYYYGLFPVRQLVKPKLEYPLWDSNWDGKEPDVSSMSANDAKQYHRHVRKYGITRHIILIRHGQYDETYKDDTLRKLTPLGISQAHYTGQRLATMLHGFHNNNNNPTTSSDNTDVTETTTTNEKQQSEKVIISKCNIKSIRVSCLTRAQETANIIASYLPTVPYENNGDANLNEGRPCHTIPPMNGPIHPKLIEIYDQQHPRIEHAYQTYFYRHSKLTKEFVPPSSSTSTSSTTTESSTNNNNNNITATSIIAAEPNKNSNNITEDTADDFDEKHEFEIIICHANVIRYFLCRALQLPPEAWLRYCPFNCSLTYITIRPTGSVSCRMVGDIGHLPYDHCTFSQHHGYNW